VFYKQSGEYEQRREGDDEEKRREKKREERRNRKTLSKQLPTVGNNSALK